jgi:hypothetical protein
MSTALSGLKASDNPACRSEFHFGEGKFRVGAIANHSQQG